MDLTTILKTTKGLFQKKQQITDIDKTLVMKEKPAVESLAFPDVLAERYNIRRSLGKGAFGIVYLAEDKKIGRLVAIKQLYKSFVKDPDIHERFMQEARIGSQLDHPNIINVFTLEEDERSSCIIMEYLGGGSLHSYMAKNKRVDIESALQIFRGIMSGLDAAHHVMAIHRDIKPPNILFDHLGAPKISDFGIALLPVDAGGSEEINTDSKKIIGTPRYMAPEQVSREGEIDARTDLYAAGAVFYEMLSGNQIYNFSGDQTFSKVKEVILHNPPSPLQEDIPEAISDFTMKLIEKDPERRYQNAERVLLEIDKLIQTYTKTPIIAATGTGKGTLGSSGPLLSSPAAMFEDVIRLLLVDRILSTSERHEMERRAERLGISNVQARALEEKIRKEMNLPSLKALKKYFSLAEAFFASNKELKLLKEQKSFLSGKRKDFKIPLEESKIIEKRAKNEAAKKTRK